MSDPTIGTGSVAQVYQEVRGHNGATGDNITREELGVLREAFARTSDGILGFGDQQSDFISSLAGDNESLATALRQPNMDYTQYLQMRGQELTARQAVFDAQHGNDISSSELEALRGRYAAAAEGSPERASLLESIRDNPSLAAAVQDSSISYARYRGMRATEASSP